MFWRIVPVPVVKLSSMVQIIRTCKQMLGFGRYFHYPEIFEAMQSLHLGTCWLLWWLSCLQTSTNACKSPKNLRHLLWRLAAGCCTNQWLHGWKHCATVCKMFVILWFFRAKLPYLTLLDCYCCLLRPASVGRGFVTDFSWCVRIDQCAKPSLRIYAKGPGSAKNINEVCLMFVNWLVDVTG